MINGTQKGIGESKLTDNATARGRRKATKDNQLRTQANPFSSQPGRLLLRLCFACYNYSIIGDQFCHEVELKSAPRTKTDFVRGLLLATPGTKHSTSLP